MAESRYSAFMLSMRFFLNGPVRLDRIVEANLNGVRLIVNLWLFDPSLFSRFSHRKEIGIPIVI